MVSVWGCPDQFGWGDAPDSSTPKRRSNGRQRRRKSSVWLGVVHLGMTPTLFGVASLLIAASLLPLRGLRR
jgi:hypothetical protein